MIKKLKAWFNGSIDWSKNGTIVCLFLCACIASAVVGYQICNLRLTGSVETRLIEARDAQREAEKKTEELSKLIELYAKANSEPVGDLPALSMCLDTSEFGYGWTRDPLGSTILHVGNEYGLRINLSGQFDREKEVPYRVKGNQVDVDFFYPSHLRAGETGRLVFLASVNDKLLTGATEFTAAEDMYLAYGDEDTAMEHCSTGCLIFDDNDGYISLPFYASSEQAAYVNAFDGLLSGNTLYCWGYAY